MQNNEVDINDFQIWGVYKLEGGKYVSLQENFVQWISKQEFSKNFLKNEETNQQLYEFQVHKVIYENNEAKMFTFYDVTNAHRCELPQFGGKCESGVLLTNLLNELKTPIEGIQQIMPTISQYITPKGESLLENLNNLIQWIDHSTRETIVFFLKKYLV